MALDAARERITGLEAELDSSSTELGPRRGGEGTE